MIADILTMFAAFVLIIGAIIRYYLGVTNADMLAVIVLLGLLVIWVVRLHHSFT